MKFRIHSIVTVFITLCLVTILFLILKSKYSPTANRAIMYCDENNIEQDIINNINNILSLYNHESLETIVPKHFFIIDDDEKTKIEIPNLTLISDKSIKRIGPEFTTQQYKIQALKELHVKSTKIIAYDDFVDTLKIKPCDHIVDMGFGFGGMTFTLAKAVPNGKLYATELTENAILFLYWKMLLYNRNFYYYKHDKDEKEKRSSCIKNIIPIIGKLDDAKLPKKEIDVIFMQNLHAFCKKPQNNTEKEREQKFLQSIIYGLKKDGTIIIIDMVHPRTPPHKTYLEFKQLFGDFELILEKKHPEDINQFILIYKIPPA